MLVELKDLTRFTIFTYEGREWQYHVGLISNSENTQEYMGEQEKDVELVQCRPRLGGVFQDKLTRYFNTNTVVTVN